MRISYYKSIHHSVIKDILLRDSYNIDEITNLLKDSVIIEPNKDIFEYYLINKKLNKFYLFKNEKFHISAPQYYDITELSVKDPLFNEYNKIILKDKIKIIISEYKNKTINWFKRKTKQILFLSLFIDYFLFNSESFNIFVLLIIIVYLKEIKNVKN